jgi:hypothetical protein
MSIVAFSHVKESKERLGSFNESHKWRLARCERGLLLRVLKRESLEEEGRNSLVENWGDI